MEEATISAKSVYGLGAGLGLRVSGGFKHAGYMGPDPSRCKDLGTLDLGNVFYKCIITSLSRLPNPLAAQSHKVVASLFAL